MEINCWSHLPESFKKKKKKQLKVIEERFLPDSGIPLTLLFSLMCLSFNFCIYMNYVNCLAFFANYIACTFPSNLKVQLSYRVQWKLLLWRLQCNSLMKSTGGSAFLWRWLFSLARMISLWIYQLFLLKKMSDKWLVSFRERKLIESGMYAKCDWEASQHDWGYIEFRFWAEFTQIKCRDG